MTVNADLEWDKEKEAEAVRFLQIHSLLSLPTGDTHGDFQHNPMSDHTAAVLRMEFNVWDP